MIQYIDLLRDIRDNGTMKTDRTGTGTKSVFGRQLRFDLMRGFPLVTTKKIHMKSVIHELLWLVSGSTNIQYLKDNNVRIWDEWADEHGELGPTYGAQWRRTRPRWPWISDIDQLQNAINMIKHTPDSRRIIINAWNVADVPAMKLPPCHLMYQFEVHDGKLNCMMTQRSCDTFLGLPFNIASYALLTHMIAHITGYSPGELIVSLGDAHIYKNHIDQVNTQLDRIPLGLSEIHINPDVKNIDDFKYSDFTLSNYFPHPIIKAQVAV